MFRFARRLASPFTRTAILAWAWSHRHEISRWGRSLLAEVRGPAPISPSRLSRIGRILWAITTDPQLARARELRGVRLVGDVVELDLDPRWTSTGRLVTKLEELPGVGEVHVRGVGPVQPAIPTTAA